MAFNFPVFSYIVALISDAFLIFFAIFHVVAFDELKTDYKNPIDQCNSLNPLVLPEYLLHIIFNVLFLLSGQWFALLMNMPLIAYHIHRYKTRPTLSGYGLYDPTSIMNGDALSKCQREGWIKLAFYLVTFFYYLYGRAFRSRAAFNESGPLQVKYSASGRANESAELLTANGGSVIAGDDRVINARLFSTSIYLSAGERFQQCVHFWLSHIRQQSRAISVLSSICIQLQTLGD